MSSVGKIAYPLPQIKDVKATEGTSELTFVIDANLKASDGHPISFQYDIGDGWKELKNNTIGSLDNGVTYNVKIRAIIADLPPSAAWPVDGLMPKAKEPTQMSASDLTYKLVRSNGRWATLVSFKRPTKLKDSGGWALENYWGCVTGGQPTRNCWDKSQVTTDQTGSVNFWSQWASGETSFRSSSPITIEKTEPPTYDSDTGLFEASFPYTASGSKCSATFKYKGNTKSLGEWTSTSTGYDTFAFSEKLSWTPPAPTPSPAPTDPPSPGDPTPTPTATPSAPAPIIPSSINWTCSINDYDVSN